MRSLPRINTGTDTAPGLTPATAARMDRALPRSRWARWRWPAAAALVVAGLSEIPDRPTTDDFTRIRTNKKNEILKKIEFRPF